MTTLSCASRSTATCLHETSAPAAGSTGRTARGGAVTIARLAPGHTLAVEDAEAAGIRIDAGEVWLTEEGSFVDHVLRAGQRYTFDRPGTALVTAQGAARVTVTAPRRGPPPARIVLEGVVLHTRSPGWRLVAWLLPGRLRRSARPAF